MDRKEIFKSFHMRSSQYIIFYLNLREFIFSLFLFCIFAAQSLPIVDVTISTTAWK